LWQRADGVVTRVLNHRVLKREPQRCSTQLPIQRATG
jgi:hypothetical protein